MADLKNNWKDAGKGLGHAFRDLGKAIANTAKTGVRKVDEWANSDDDKKESAEEKNAEDSSENK